MIPFGKVMLFRLQQRLKACLLMVVTLSGRVTLVNLVQSANAEPAMVVKLSGDDQLARELAVATHHDCLVVFDLERQWTPVDG